MGALLACARGLQKLVLKDQSLIAMWWPSDYAEGWSPKAPRAWYPLKSLQLKGCLGFASNLIPPGPPWCSGEMLRMRPPPASAVELNQPRPIRGSAQNKLSINGHHDNNHSWIFSRAHTLHPCVDGGCVKGFSQLKRGGPLSPLSATLDPNQSPPSSLEVGPGEQRALAQPRGGEGRRRLANVLPRRG